MNESIAGERPLKPFYQALQPVSSSYFLSNMQDGIVLDMGGTTTISLFYIEECRGLIQTAQKLEDGTPRVSAVEATTFGLGGDSRIHFG